MRALIIAAVLLFGGCGQSGSSGGPKACIDFAGAPEMILISGGVFRMGEDPYYPEEGPAHLERVDDFWIDVHEVTNAQFEAFIKVTGYVTMAEQTPPPLPGAPSEMLLPGSAVFSLPSPQDMRWWRWVVGAQWRHPSGPAESIDGRGAEPAVQIAYEDAEAYARWAGKQIPTEAQWEYAARAGQKAGPEPLDENGEPQANYYQGIFPVMDQGLDGYRSRAPAGCFKPNAFGLYDMIGNVWEWTRDAGGGHTGAYIIKGGSYLCASNYCARYRPAARQFQERGLGTDHIGFRLVSSSDQNSDR
ncbi:MAG: formylglycine-generating enzyme family protein [Alphaproteobacteria bacterium]|nr:formylglycine-generating enzyme family protein [Alphaproteobacteria bacterium]